MTLKSIRKTAFATVLAALGTASVSCLGTANATLPGTDFGGRVVVTDSNAMTVTVNRHLPSTAQVTGTLRNNTGTQFNCAVPGLDGATYPGQVTEAQIVKDSMDYYAQNIFRESGIMAPVIGPVGTGSLYNIMPSGSMANSLGNSTGLLLQIRTAQDAARVAGHTGDPRVGNNKTFNVGANSTVNWLADLGVPSTGTRTDFDAAAMFFCTSAGQAYVFAGYETGTTPPATEIGRLSWS